LEPNGKRKQLQITQIQNRDVHVKDDEQCDLSKTFPPKIVPKGDAPYAGVPKDSALTETQSQGIKTKVLNTITEVETKLMKSHPDHELIILMRTRGDNLPETIKDEIYVNFQKILTGKLEGMEKLIGFTQGCISMNNINKENSFKHLSENMAQIVLTLMEHNKTCELATST